MSGSRKCAPCCGEEPDPPTEECGCDGPVYVSVNSANATWSIVVCEASPDSCIGENWAGKGVEWTIESRFYDLAFECVPPVDSTPAFWQMKDYADHPTQFTFAVALSGDSFDFNPDMEDGEACSDTWSPAGSMDLTFESDDLPDGVSIERWEGTIRNRFLFGYPDERAVLDVDIRIRVTDRFDDWTSLVLNFSTFQREVVPNNPQLVFRIRILAVADTVFGPDDCPTDLVWTDHQIFSFTVEGIPMDPTYAEGGGQFANGSWVVPPDGGPDCETLCDTPPYPDEAWGCGGGTTSWLDLLTGSDTGISTTGIRYASWDDPTMTILDYETAPAFP